MNQFELDYLKNSFSDAWEEYSLILSDPSAGWFDYVVLTASNCTQREMYEEQISELLLCKSLPTQSIYLVVADPEEKRIGSGGATLNVLKAIAERDSRPLSDIKTLIIHSGGSSQRIPHCAIRGKIFSYTGTQLPDGRHCTLLEETLVGFCMVPARMNGGALVLSGDVLLSFNALQCDFQTTGAVVLSAFVGVQYGTRHGVFVINADTLQVTETVQKGTLRELWEKGAVSNSDTVAIDTGAVWLSGEVLTELQKIETSVGHSLYTDWLYPMTSSATLEGLLSQPAEMQESAEETAELRKLLWNALSEFRLNIRILSPARFLHLGTTEEYLHLHLSRQAEAGSSHAVVLNSVVSGDSVLEDGALLEDSCIESCAVVQKGAMLCGVSDFSGILPRDTVLCTIPLVNGQYISLLYGIADNPKTNHLFGVALDRLQSAGVKSEDLFLRDSPQTLWNASIYPVADTEGDSQQLSLLLHKIIFERATHQEMSEWRQSRRFSISEAVSFAQHAKILENHQIRRGLFLIRQFMEASCLHGSPFRQTAAFLPFDFPLSKIDEALCRTEFPLRQQMYYSLSTYMPERTQRNSLRNRAFESLSQTLMEAYGPFPPAEGLAKREVEVKLPVRVNLAGGWSDTPPYCNQYGGTVLNLSVLLEGEYPISVKASVIPDPIIVVENRSSGVRTTYTCKDDFIRPFSTEDPLTLHRVALHACGLVPQSMSVESFLKNLGGGIALTTHSTLPVGSGLGASSILSAAVIKALLVLTGQPCTESYVADRTFVAEQMMLTGGGWQDQWGALIPGIKLLSTSPGLYQNVQVQPLHLSPAVRKSLEDRLLLIYSGHRRLAKNLLRSLMGKVFENEILILQKIDTMKNIAVLMKHYLEQGRMDRFVDLMNEHYSVLTQIDRGVTNRYIDLIFQTCSDMVCGKMICGAGGGGFLQVFAEQGVTREMLQANLKQTFGEYGPSVYSISISEE